MSSCSGCGKERTPLNTNRYSLSSDGLQRYCRECNSEKCISWRKANPDRVAAHRHKRRAMIQTTELTEQTVALYWCQRWLKCLTGLDLHIDHVVPLSKGGLHHQINLEIVHAEYNLSKGAKMTDQLLARANR